MARQEGACWRCGAACAATDDAPAPAVAIDGTARAPQSGIDRWINEGGSIRAGRREPALAAGSAAEPPAAVWQGRPGPRRRLAHSAR
jgi:hypothetical protein